MKPKTRNVTRSKRIFFDTLVSHMITLGLVQELMPSQKAETMYGRRRPNREAGSGRVGIGVSAFLTQSLSTTLLTLHLPVKAQYKAWVVHDGNHRTRLRNENWNSLLIWKPRSELAYAWDLMEEECNKETFSKLSERIKTGMTSLQKAAKGELQGTQHGIRTPG